MPTTDLQWVYNTRNVGFIKDVLIKLFYQFFAANLLNYLWCHQVPMKNDITTIKNDFKIQDKLQLDEIRVPYSSVGDSAGFKTFKIPVLTIRYISLTNLCAFGT